MIFKPAEYKQFLKQQLVLSRRFEKARTELLAASDAAAPMLRRLLKSKDKSFLLKVGEELHSVGCWEARHFFSRVYELQEKQGRKAKIKRRRASGYPIRA